MSDWIQSAGFLIGLLGLTSLIIFGVGTAEAQYVDTTRITSEGEPGFKGDGEFANSIGAFRSQPEIIIGAPRENLGNDEGVTYLVNPETGDIVETLTTANSTNLGRFGAAVSSFADSVVVGAPNEDPPSGETGAGYAYLFDGTNGTRLMTFQTSSGGAEREDGRALGAAVAGIGDINGDNKPDFVVGAPGKSVSGNDEAGKVYIFSGADGSVLNSVTGAEEPGGRFGESLLGVGDIVGDSSPDFLVGAPEEDDTETTAGRVYLFDGGDLSTPTTLTAPSGNQVAGGQFGNALAKIGADSLVIGAFQEDGGGPDKAGRVYLYDGTDLGAGPLLEFTSASPEQNGEFGRSVSGLPDMNRDGSPDVLVGAPNEDTDADGNTTDNQGRAYVMSGADGSIVDVLESPNAVSGGQFGDAIAGISDIGTDGLPEVVTGALGETVSGLARAGRAYTFSIPEIAFVDGREGEAYDPAEASAGDEDVPVGRFKLSTNDSRSKLEGVTVSNQGTSVSDITAIELWSSANNSFETGDDTKLLEKSYSTNTTFSAFTASIATDGTYFFVIVDLGSNPSGEYDPAIASEAAIDFTDGQLSTVNGADASGFSVSEGDGYLSTGPTGPLPVELASFDAVLADDNVRLTWRTASETNNAGFQVQRRGASSSWEEVGEVDGHGTTSQTETYTFTDEALPYSADTLRYRLAQTDFDGTVHYSDPIAVTRETVNRVELLGTYPNPAREQATLRYALPERQKVTIALYDVLGQKVRTIVSEHQEGRHAARVDVSDLSSGVYFLRLTADGAAQTERLTVVR